jgi:hypothetical protein
MPDTGPTWELRGTTSTLRRLQRRLGKRFRSPTLGECCTGHYRWRVPTPPAVVAVCLLAVIGAICSGCETTDAGPLSGETWVLTSAVDDGVPVELGGYADIGWRFIDDGCEGGGSTCPSGPKLTGNDACNDFTRSIRIDDARVAWGDYWRSTLVGCSGGLADTFSKFFHDASFQYVVIDDELRLVSSDGQVELTLRSR